MASRAASPAASARPWRGGVALAAALAGAGYVNFTDKGAALSQSGHRFLAEAGISLPASRRPVCLACLDWSERRPHLAGALGAALAAHGFARGWIERIPGGRALRLTDAGRAGFARELGVAG